MHIKQVIVARRRFPDGKGGEFKIRDGKLAAQVAHASMKVFFDRKIEPAEVGLNDEALVIPLTPEMRAWVHGTFTKIVLGVDTEAELLAIYEAAKAADLPTAIIQDLGATEFHGVPTYTTVAIGPADAAAIDRITGPNGSNPGRML